MTEEQPVEFGTRLRQLRKRLELTQKEFGEKVGVATNYISRLEVNQSHPGYEFLSKLFHAYRINPLFLLKGEEPVFFDKDFRWRIEEKEKKEVPSILYTNPYVPQLLDYMERSSAVRYAILESFSRYKVEFRDVIEEQFKEYDEQNQG